jgi:hypothetical protein
MLLNLRSLERVVPPQENYRMPEPYTTCLWAPADGLEWSPALVTRVGRNAISLVVFSYDARMGLPKDGVRYFGDPSVFQISPDEGGIWKYTPDQELLRQLLGIKDDYAALQPKKRKAEVA